MVDTGGGHDREKIREVGCKYEKFCVTDSKKWNEEVLYADTGHDISTEPTRELVEVIEGQDRTLCLAVLLCALMCCISILVSFSALQSVGKCSVTGICCL